MEPEAGLDAVSPRDERSRAGLEHWPAEVWSDYAAAYVRLTTLRSDGDHHLLFGCVELLPREIAPSPSHRAPRLSLPRGASAMSSLTVLTPEAALQWYEGALSGMVALPGVDAPPTIRAVRLAAEPRLGDLVVARVATVPVGWQTGPRMHRLVPMEELPEPVHAALDGTRGRTPLGDWLVEHCFVDLTTHPDCAGGLVLLAANPVLRSASEYPLRKLPDGREVLGIRLVPRAGQSLDTLSVRLSEMRPDGPVSTLEVELDGLGEGKVILPQEARETALEVSCSRRGLLHAPPRTGFLRSVVHQIRPVRSTMSVEIPARSKSRPASRYEVPIADAGLTVASRVGSPAELGASARLDALLALRAKPLDRDAEQILFGGDRRSAVEFVRGLVSHAVSRVIFIDSYFSFDDIREFALSAWSGSCDVAVLTSTLVGWTGRIEHLAGSKLHGDLMIADLTEINGVRNCVGHSSIQVGIMGSAGFHDRFLVVDESVWHFGDSFRSLGNAVSMASRVRDLPSLLPMLLSAHQQAVPFAEYWTSVKQQHVAR